MLESKSNFFQGVVNMLIASLFFAIMGALVKISGKEIGSVEIVFFRNFFASLLILVSVFNKPLNNKGGRSRLLIFRGVSGTVALMALFYNMTQIGLGVAITFLQTSPIFVAIFGSLFLKEKLSWASWVAILIGFAGILFIFRPDIDTDWTTNLLGLLNGIVAGAAYTSVRGLRNHYETRAIVFSFTVAGTVIPFFCLLAGEAFPDLGMDYFFAAYVMPQDIQWLWLVLIAASSLGGQVFVTRAYGKERAGIIAAIGYMTVPFALVIGTVMGDPFPDIYKLTGMALVIISGILISLTKNKN